MDLYIDRPENITISDVGNPCSSFGQTQKCGLYIHVHVAYVNELIFWGDFFGCLMPFQQYFSYIMTTRFSGGRSPSTRREPPTMGKQRVNFITCGCESNAPFFVIYKAGREPTPYW